MQARFPKSYRYDKGNLVVVRFKKLDRFDKNIDLIFIIIIFIIIANIDIQRI